MTREQAIDAAVRKFPEVLRVARMQKLYLHWEFFSYMLNHYGHAEAIRSEFRRLMGAA